jgi:hypothetical protein
MSEKTSMYTSPDERDMAAEKITDQITAEVMQELGAGWGDMALPTAAFSFAQLIEKLNAAILKDGDDALQAQMALVMTFSVIKTIKDLVDTKERFEDVKYNPIKKAYNNVLAKLPGAQNPIQINIEKVVAKS